MAIRSTALSHHEKRGAGSSAHSIMFRAELLDLFKVTAPTIWNWMERRGFPRPKIIGGRDAWYRSEVQQWIDAQPRRKIKGDDPPPEQQQPEG
jgi:predicted DNA-binding transcriptional regulator AlpA